jgi:hypothetical protein
MPINFTYEFQNIFRSRMPGPVYCGLEKLLTHSTGNMLRSLQLSVHHMASVQL